jgi:asparagine N-glycosylation enzyme membrane subunit Stt3
MKGRAFYPFVLLLTILAIIVLLMDVMGIWIIGYYKVFCFAVILVHSFVAFNVSWNKKGEHRTSK